ncbi:MAG: glutaredoxin [Candidatus Delongbacteria bacterium]|nr:glutaredoxin [Candidatus Delongbacteria bacterium]
MSQVKDVHGKYKVSYFPSLLCFENGKFVNVIKGSHDESFYNLEFSTNLEVVKKKSVKAQKKVVVYTSPDCIWCAKVKKYLKENNIRFTDFDVSKDKDKMYELIKKSGKMGVPQTQIGSTIIFGFDKAKINQLLNIKG